MTKSLCAPFVETAPEYDVVGDVANVVVEEHAVEEEHAVGAADVEGHSAEEYIYPQALDDVCRSLKSSKLPLDSR